MKNKSRKRFHNVLLLNQEIDQISVHDVKPDGNCLSRALSLSSFNNQSHYLQIKQLISAELKRHASFYINILLFTKEEIIKAIYSAEVDGEWMGLIHLIAYSNASHNLVILHTPTTKEGKSSGVSTIFFPFRTFSWKRKRNEVEFNIKGLLKNRIDISWHLPMRQAHFVVLRGIKSFPADIYQMNTLLKKKWICFKAAESLKAFFSPIYQIKPKQLFIDLTSDSESEIEHQKDVFETKKKEVKQKMPAKKKSREKVVKRPKEVNQKISNTDRRVLYRAMIQMIRKMRWYIKEIK